MKRFKIEDNRWDAKPDIYVTLYNPPYEDEDVLARVKWKAKDVTITEMKSNEVEE